ncbi:putative methyltransferase-domain-containing protein [Clohesyomyces aquaticus]|uniref:25S rRNA adenine-N(1) methyltransferase n=1 Tax=Clohesyomyces aquaticus TaxID=1231657 RepID=A0A1Y1YK97_9PLEO|nr:putative methyltransferase-domain-containing protein [Clohesyomyces aquaticus]
MAVKKRPKTLAHGRPPAVRKNHDGASMSAKATRNIIRTHHRLHKELATAVKNGDTTLAATLENEIERNGGLKVYQAASKQGQSKSRGGDSSKVLVDWLQRAGIIETRSRLPKRDGEKSKPAYKLLEVGALSTDNEVSKFPDLIEVTRIDLNSQGPGITQQDFMERPYPKSESEMFEIISLSLVLNYVPDPVQRGEMLKRVVRFLRPRKPQSLSQPSGSNVLPALFLVLPLPCVSNSRYMDEERLMGIMANLGFSVRERKNTAKLCHYLLTLDGEANGTKSKKDMLRDSAGMNNFCVVVD